VTECDATREHLLDVIRNQSPELERTSVERHLRTRRQCDRIFEREWTLSQLLGARPTYALPDRLRAQLAARRRTPKGQAARVARGRALRAGPGHGAFGVARGCGTWPGEARARRRGHHLSLCACCTPSAHRNRKADRRPSIRPHGGRSPRRAFARRTKDSVPDQTAG
jgi:hypothetical protein